MVLNNMKYKNKLGIFVTCFDETKAIEQALLSLKSIYPDIPIYLTHESDEDFSFLNDKISNIVINKGEDSMGPVLGLSENNYQSEKQQESIKNASLTLINIFINYINHLDSEYILLHCPDTFIRGKLNIPENSGLLGSQVNRYFPDSTNEILIKNGGIPIHFFGAVPAIFNTDDFLRAKDILLSDGKIIDDLCKSFYAIFSHDILMPILFSLIGKSEEFNSEIVECERNYNWQNTSHPLIHQFRFFYPNRTSKYKVNE
jgi:hypothetical protein